MSEDLSAALVGRPGWRLEADAAVYAPPGEDRSARVRPVPPPARARESWHAVVLELGTARHIRPGATAAEAVRWARRLVDAGNARERTPGGR